VARKPISEWPLAERPREKLLRDGSRTLSDAELLAIILRLGTKGASAIDVARDVLSHFGGFRRMADADSAEWRQIKGLGTAKTAAVIAAVEIARRFWAEPAAASVPIKSASQVVDLLGPHLRDLKHEVLDVLLLNGKHLTNAGLAKYSTVLERVLVDIRLMVIGSIYLDWCAVAHDERHDDEPAYWLDATDISPIHLGQLVGLDEDLEGEDPRAAAVHTLIRSGRPQVLSKGEQEGAGGAGGSDKGRSVNPDPR